MQKSEIESLLKKYHDDYLKYFSTLNNLAEPSLQEFKTTNYIATQLDNLNIKYQRLTTNNGLFGELDFGSNKTIAFRADIDGLPRPDGTFAHLCGHSSHSAGLLTALHIIIKEKIKVPFNLRFVFQPAEEIGEGAHITLAEKAYDKIDFGISVHNWMAPKDELILCHGATMSGAVLSSLEVTGPGGHSSFSNDIGNPVIDLIKILYHINEDLEKLDLKKMNANFCISQVQGSEQRNIITTKATAKMYYHYYEAKDLELFKKIIDQHTKVTNDQLQAKVTHKLIIASLYNNDEDVLDFVKQQVANTNIKLTETKDLFIEGSEDFSFVMQKHKGVQLMLGIHDQEKLPMLHNQKFNAANGSPISLVRLWLALIAEK